MRCLPCIRRMVGKDDTDTERRRGRGKESVYYVSIEWYKKTTRIQRDEDEEEVKVPLGLVFD